MRRRERLFAILLLLLLVSVVKVGQQVYRWFAYADERVEIARLDAQLEEAAIGVIDTQIGADSLRSAIDSLDAALRLSRDRLDSYERRATRGVIPATLALVYREELDAHNLRVDERNALVRDWQTTVDRNHLLVERFNLLADSIRTLAERMGEPYYPIRSPAEIVARRDEMETTTGP